jgi:hypothetical protein
MFTQNLSLGKKNSDLKDENKFLAEYVRKGQELVHSLSVNLQRYSVNIMPNLTVNQNIFVSNSSQNSEISNLPFVQTGKTKLIHHGTCVSENNFLSIGHKNGDISIWKIVVRPKRKKKHFH